MPRLLAVAVLFIVLLALAACGSGAKEAPTPTPAQAKAATQAPAPPSKATTAAEAPKPAAIATPKPVVTHTTAAAEEALPVPKPAALKSYIARIELRAEVTEPEPGLEAWSVIEMAYRLEPGPAAYRMFVVDKTGQERPDLEIIAIGPDMYVRDPDNDTWMRLPAAAGFSTIMQTMVDPEALTRDAPVDIFTSANVVNRNAMVDGVAITHYRATEVQIRALIAKGQVQVGQDQKIISATADFWVAQKGDYLKQYRTVTVHEAPDSRQITTIMRMVITDENKPLTIEPPTR